MVQAFCIVDLYDERNVSFFRCVTSIRTVKETFKAIGDCGHKVAEVLSCEVGCKQGLKREFSQFYSRLPRFEDGEKEKLLGIQHLKIPRYPEFE